MNATSETTTLTPSQADRLAHALIALGERAGARRLALFGVLCLSAVMNTYALAQNGYANAFYSAGVKSMLISLHNFLFVSADPGGLISIDKPPLALWLQVASAKILGFSPLALLLPEAIAGVLSVAVIYMAINRSFGRTAATAAALCLAVFPSFVAISRDNNPDALLILLMLISCWIALRAIENGRLSTLLACAVALGLAFNTKTLASWLVIPGIALAYALCAPGSLRARIGKLLLGGVLLAAVSLAWLMFVDLTPASQRPYVGSSRHNSELGLTFDYNGFGRLDGQSGGPGRIAVREGAYVPLPPPRSEAALAAQLKRERALAARLFAGAPLASAPRSPARAPTLAQILAARPPRAAASRPPEPALLPDGRAREPTPFGSAPGPLRLLQPGFGGQAGWILPFSLFGMLALAIVLLARRGSQAEDRAAEPWRQDGRLASLIVFGGWFAVEAIFLSFARGIVHPYYTSALGPGAAAMAGVGAVSLAQLRRRGRGWVALIALAVLTSTLAQIVLLQRDHYMRWFIPLLIACAAAAVLAAIKLRRRATVAVGLALAALLPAPAAFAAATWGAPVQGTFPVAGPWGAPGHGGVNVGPEKLASYRQLLAFLSHHRTGSRFSILTVSSVVSAPMTLMGTDASSLAGYSGDDPALSAAGLARLVARGEARYVLLGGPYSSRGGNEATRATLKACAEVPARAWGGGVRTSPFGLVLFDCGGEQRALLRVGAQERARRLLSPHA